MIFHFFRCVGGGLVFQPSLLSESSKYPSLCGENGRYSPPVVMFGDEGVEGEVRIVEEETTPRTQWLLHFSFTSSSHHSLGVKMTGGHKVAGTGIYDTLTPGSVPPCVLSICSRFNFVSKYSYQH